MTKFFKKFKKICLEAILGTFCLNSGRNEFSYTKGLSQFLDIPIIYHRAKNQKKLLSHFWEKVQTDGWTDRQRNRWTDRQQWFYRTLRRTGVQKECQSLSQILLELWKNGIWKNARFYHWKQENKVTEFKKKRKKKGK